MSDKGFRDYLTAQLQAGMSLKRVGNVTQITYSSAIAHRLSARYSVPVTELATCITDTLNQLQIQADLSQFKRLLSLPLPTPAFQHLIIHAMPSGLVQIELTDRAIAYWLDSLIHSSLEQKCHPLGVSEQQRASLLSTHAMFAAQHAHARSCSLLRLADREGRIQLSCPEADPVLWQWQRPNPLPWLAVDSHLHLRQAVDRALIGQLFAVVEELGNPTRQPLNQTVLRWLEGISQCFESCHAAHPVWGEAHPSEMSIAYLGLLHATQRVLHRILVDCLNTSAPSAL